MTSQNWKAVLGDQIPEERGREIETFAGQVELRRQNKVDEKVFAETRLRWGIYGQRYDNGQRYDGTKTQTITYPSGDLTKGPNKISICHKVISETRECSIEIKFSHWC